MYRWLFERRFTLIRCSHVLWALVAYGCIHSNPSNISSENSCVHDDRTLRCVRYVDNYDGDTAKFNIDGVHWLLREKLRVRLIGIDAPEMKDTKGHVRGPCEKRMALRSGAFLRSRLTEGSHIDIVNIQGWDNFGRVLADVAVDRVGLSALMLRKNLAFPYKKNGDWCELENQ